MVWLEKKILGRRSVKEIFAVNKIGKKEGGMTGENLCTMANWDRSNDLYGKDVF